MNPILPSPVVSNGYTVRVDGITASEWSRLLTQFDDASIYQTWEYGAIRWGENQLSHLVLKKDDAVMAIAQVRIVRLPVIGRGIAYVRWGPLCRLRGQNGDEDVLRRVISALKDEYVDRRKLMLRVIPSAFEEDTISAVWKSTLAAAGFRPAPSIHVYHTMRVDLTLPPEEMRKRLDQKWRNQLNAAERNGLQVLEGTSDEFFGRFSTIYKEMLARKRFETTVDVDEFGKIHGALPPNLKMVVLLCEKEGKLMAGMVGSVVGRTGIYLLGATTVEGMKAKGSYLLQWRMMQLQRQHGCLWYDLGGINSERNPSVYHFKCGMGGQEIRQLGGYQFSGDWVNSLVVSCGEHLRTTLRPSKWFRSGNPALSAS